MFVDDSEDMMSIVEHYAEHNPGVFFTIRKGGFSAMQYLQNRNFRIDAVISDLMMPDMGGIKLAKKIREGERACGEHRMKIFWYTNLDFDQNDKYDPYTSAMLDYGIEKVFSKSQDLLEVIEEVKEAIRPEGTVN